MWLRSLVFLTLCACRPPVPSPDAGPPAAEWRVVQSELPTALLSTWEGTDGVLYAVGGNSTRALVLRHDATGWWEMDPGTSRALWWVHGLSSNDVYAVGASGVITHFDGTRWSVEREGGDFTLYGVWGTSRPGLLAVGGDVTSNQPRGVVLSKGTAWGELSTSLPQTTPLFKIWGRSSNDFFIVGERGAMTHGSGGSFATEVVATSQRLTTVAGSGASTCVVGGLSEPVLFRRVDASWRRVPVPGDPALLNGVAVDSSGTAVVVGLDGYVAEGQGETFNVVAPVTSLGLHGVVATRGGFVAVGGDLLGTFGRGVLVARGPLEGGALQAWPHAGVRWDGGQVREDAGIEDAGLVEPDGGWLGPGVPCDGRFSDCRPELACWFVFGPYKSWCGALCTDVSQCGDYGPNASCKVPGPQVMDPVCLPEAACDAGS